MLGRVLAYIPGGRQTLDYSHETIPLSFVAFQSSKMLANSLRNPAIAKGLCFFGIFLCTLILTKQIRNAPFLQGLRSSFLMKSLQERLEVSEQIWEESVVKRHAIYDTIVDPLKPMYCIP